MNACVQLFVVGCVMISASAKPQYQPQYQPQPYSGQQYSSGSGGAYTSPIPIISQSQEGPNPDGSYHYAYKTGNGIEVEESGILKNAGNPQVEAKSAQGFFAFPGTDGRQYVLQYTADENGFQPKGDHLPVPPGLTPEQQAVWATVQPDTNQYDDQGNLIGGSQVLPQGKPQYYGRRR